MINSLWLPRHRAHGHTGEPPNVKQRVEVFVARGPEEAKKSIFPTWVHVPK